MTATLTLSTPHDSPELRAALLLIESFLDLDITLVDDKDGADLFYGNSDSHPAPLHVPRHQGYDRASIPLEPSSESKARYGYDLFDAILFWISDRGHVDFPAEKRDQYGRVPASTCLQQDLGILNTPIVNVYLQHFGQWLAPTVKIGSPRHIPAGKRAVVLLSHDVDCPIDPKDLPYKTKMALRAFRRGDKTTAISQVASLTRSLRDAIVSRNDSMWTFDDVVREEAKRGFESTFFFAATAVYDKGADKRDVAYDIRDKRFRKTMHDINASGAEVGLHYGYNTAWHKDGFKREIQSLESVIQTRVWGGRHHYWRTGPNPIDTFRQHEEAGLRYDMSVSFNNEPGFRLGVGYPLHLPDPKLKRPLRTLQIPSFAMDGAVMGFYTEPRSVQQAIDLFESLVDNLKKHQCAAALDWHLRNAFPGSPQTKPWGDVYLGILDVLAADKDVAVMTGRDLCEAYFETASPWQATWMAS